jgi:hypothetical protein
VYSQSQSATSSDDVMCGHLCSEINRMSGDAMP